MKYEKLFDDNERYTALADQISNEFCAALVPIVIKYKNICKVRELQLLAEGAILDATLSELLDPKRGT